MKTAVAMSGGVDSSVAAVLLKSQGHNIVGVTARFFSHPDFENHVFSESLEDAKKLCHNMGIEHFTFDFSGDYRKACVHR